MKKVTRKVSAYELADDALNEQRPIDSRHLRNLYNSCKNEKERREWAKGCLEASMLYTGNESPQLIGRAASQFLTLIRREM